MPMNRYLLTVAALLALTGCAGKDKTVRADAAGAETRQARSVSFAQEKAFRREERRLLKEALALEQAVKKKAGIADLPAGTYQLYCIYNYPVSTGLETPRARVVGVGDIDDGWQTAMAVPLAPITAPPGTPSRNNFTNCAASVTFAAGDSLKVLDPTSTDTLQLEVTRGGSTTTLALEPGEPAAAPAWYQTPEKDPSGANYPIQYFVYFADVNRNVTTKFQNYRIEAFDLAAGTTQCLAERPVLNGNVKPIAMASSCLPVKYNENGTGSGFEPK